MRNQKILTLHPRRTGPGKQLRWNATFFRVNKPRRSPRLRLRRRLRLSLSPRLISDSLRSALRENNNSNSNSNNNNCNNDNRELKRNIPDTLLKHHHYHRHQQQQRRQQQQQRQIPNTAAAITKGAWAYSGIGTAGMIRIILPFRA